MKHQFKYLMYTATNKSLAFSIQVVSFVAAAPELPLYFYPLTRKQYYCHLNTQCVHDVVAGVMRLCLEVGVNRNEHGVKDVDEAIGEFLKIEKEKHAKITSQKKKKSSWFGIYGTKFQNITYRNMDTSKLLNILPKVTEICQENNDADFQSLWDSIGEIKNIRNDVMHVDNNVTYSEHTVARISDVLEEIVDKLAKLYIIDSTEVDSIKIEIQEEIERLQDSQQSNEENIICEITRRVIDENRNTWAPMVMKTMQVETLQFGNEIVSLSKIFHEIGFEVICELDQFNSTTQNSQDRETFDCTDILSRENCTNIEVIEGDAGSGKSTFLRMMSIEFCSKRTDSIFKSISSYQLMLFINCRDKTSDRFWHFFETNYNETAKSFPEKWVLLALRRIKLIIAIDGLDESNECSKALVRDVIHLFASSETVKFLIMTRPGFSKYVVEQFDQNAIQYRILNIEPIRNINDQEKFISRVITQIPSVKFEDIIKIFRTIHDNLNSYFQRPLGLILFITLFHYFPEKTDQLTNELGIMQLSVEMHSKNMAGRMPTYITNTSKSAKAILEQLCRISLQLIQNKCYEINQENFNRLTDECYKINKNIPVESVLSCVLMKQKYANTTITGIHNFSHRSQQEYLASKVLTKRLQQEHSAHHTSSQAEASSGNMLEVLRALTGERVETKDLDRLALEKTSKLI